LYKFQLRGRLLCFKQIAQYYDWEGLTCSPGLITEAVIAQAESNLLLMQRGKLFSKSMP